MVIKEYDNAVFICISVRLEAYISIVQDTGLVRLQFPIVNFSDLKLIIARVWNKLLQDRFRFVCIRFVSCSTTKHKLKYY